MNHLFLFLLALLLITGPSCTPEPSDSSVDYIYYEVDLKTQNFGLYWKDRNGDPFRSIGALKAALYKDGKDLLFAMNGGMYKTGNTPQGLYIADRKQIIPLDTSSGNGNFYLKPNGVFYTTTEGKGAICLTEDFESGAHIAFATQSGPMLVINDEVHPAFKERSENLNIRNGVGVLPSGKVLFAMSRKPVSFYAFARFFKDAGCKNALYLDGFVSRAYLPARDWVQEDGDFGVIMAVTKDR